MDNFARKTFVTSRSLTYTYYDSAPRTPGDSGKPALLLLHGFPDGAKLWFRVIQHLESLPNRIIAPDLLGYGGTSNPVDASLFNSKAMTTDLAELLAAEKISRVIVIGHDWGSFLATRVWMWQPQLVAGVAMLNVHYIPPSGADLNAINELFENATGLPRYAYWEFFANQDDAPAMIEANLESFWTILHGDKDHLMQEHWCQRDAMRRFVESDTRLPHREYAKPGGEGALKEEWFAFAKEKGVASPLCWYKAWVHGHHWAVEKDLPQERLPITVPSFFLGCTGDDVCLPALIEQNKEAGLVPDLTVKVIDSAHWSPYEKPAEVGQGLHEWISNKF
ncbi:Alpha/beta hydrolase fold-1 [Macrophomina phaseolina MS6]|uniref:Alpha/beta hydrolase fold-1 n=1 Tax=Macrophomina phaseolina (strain MS6) TaxID=1126212 RepID=K2RHZ8_MACPH|nr:Alpha/beta hydrolase fold-1 [Macrophomina phaseolina MS6]